MQPFPLGSEHWPVSLGQGPPGICPPRQPFWLSVLANKGIAISNEGIAISNEGIAIAHEAMRANEGISFLSNEAFTGVVEAIRRKICST